MRTIFIQILIVAMSLHATAQQTEQAFLGAYAEKGAQEFFYKNSRASSGGYLYVAGTSLNDDGHYDMLLTKYNGTTELWSVSWNGAASGDDYAASIVVDGSGSIIISGTSEVTSTNYDCVLVKYNTSGAIQWATTYAGSAGLLDGFVSVTVDGSNNLYACGGTISTTEQSNFLTVKYNSSGAQQWVSIYDGNDFQDLAVKCVVSGTTVRTSGGSQINATDWTMTTVSYNTSTGAQGGVNQTGGDDEGVDQVRDVWTDGTNTYVVGAVRNTTLYDWKILKLDANLTVTWSATYNGADNLDDIANSVKVDGAGNVYVTGFTTLTGEGKNFLTRKYNSSGTLQWSKSFHYVQDDESFTLELDANGHVLISGSSYKDGNLDYLTIKYKYTDGTEVWRTDNFNSDYNDDDIPSNIALDEVGNIYVIGTAGTGNGKTTYMLCKYSIKTVYAPVPTDSYSSSGGYVTNKGQLRNEDGTSNTSFKYICNSSGIATTLDDSRIAYIMSHIDNDIYTIDTICRVDMRWTKGSTNAKIYPLDELVTYNNYSLGHMARSAMRTPMHNSVVKIDTYTNTDIHYTHSPTGVRHYIVARSGAPTSDFEMTFSGHTSLSVNGNGDLVVGNLLGGFTIEQAVAYSMNATTGILTLLGWQPTYSISGGNKVSFSSLGSWTGSLVIELNEKSTIYGGTPESNGNLWWSSFYGTDANDAFSDVSADENGNSSFVGTVSDLIILGEGVGSSVGNFIASQDAIIANFDINAINVWNYFVGGNGSDVAQSVDIDANGNVYCVGQTFSNNLSNDSDLGLDFSDGSVDDGFYVKVNSLGQTLVDSYIASDGSDAARAVVVNGNDVFIIGHCASPTNFVVPPSGTGYVQNFAGGNADGYIIKLSGVEQEPVWSTFFGGNLGDFIYEADFANDELVISGLTFSATYSSTDCNEPSDGGFPKCHSGNWSNTWTAASTFPNYFVASIDEVNELSWSTYITASADFSTPDECGLALRSQGSTAHIYLAGQAAGSGLNNFDDQVFGNWNIDPSLYTTWYSGTFICWWESEGGEHTLKWGSLLHDGDFNQTISVTTDPNTGYLFVGGSDGIGDIQSEIDYCTVPQNYEFPLCNAGGLNYMEITDPSNSGARSYLMVFDTGNNPRWISLFGMDSNNRIVNLTTGGDQLFICGDTENPWTLLEYDEEDELDYYKNTFGPGNGLDATLARFTISTTVELDELQTNELSNFAFIYPNPAEDVLNIQLHSRSGEVQIEAYDATGKLVYQLVQTNPDNLISLNTQYWSQGLYNLRISLDGTMQTIPFIKQ